MIKRIFVAFLLLVLFLECDSVVGQRNQSLPTAAYYSGFLPFYSADYGEALKLFERGSNSALKFGTEGRFMDSACYWTMAGECHYHMGNLPEAISYYEQALELLLSHARGDWAQRIFDQSDSIKPSSSALQRAAINWHRSTRNAKIANVPNSFPVFFGQIDPARAVFEGGVVDRPEIRPVDHREIMRCVALAIYRRGQIKGVTNTIDPFTSNLISGIARLPDELPTLGKWNLMIKGLSDMSAGKHDRAVAKIKSSLQIRGMDHDLTPIGLLALAQIAFLSGEDDVAIQLAMETAFCGAVFEQLDIVEEAFSLATKCHLANNKSVPPNLVPAIAWSANRRARKLQTSLIVQLADSQIEAGDKDAAATTLNQTRRSMSRTDLGRSIHAAKIRYLSALLAYTNFDDGGQDLKKSLQQHAPHSLWRYQLALTNNALASGGISQLQAGKVYDFLLGEIGEKHWKYDPIEAMTYLISPHVGSMEQWFEILLARKNHEAAIEIAERIRRHRFYASLPMSGRLLAIRWISTAPEKLLNKNSLLQRKSIDEQYPKLRKSVQRTEEIEREIRAMPLQPAPDSPQVKKQRDLFVEQLKHARYQESVFAALALRRLPADFVFPATTDYSGLSKAVGERQLIVSSIKTGSGYHQYILTQQTRRYLGVVRERDMRRSVAGLYKALGIADVNNAVDATLLQGKEWQAKATELKSLIFKEFHDDQWDNVDELVVVPDGVLWYVPFEILQTGENDKQKNLHESVRIRYLPMISFVTESRMKNNPASRVAVVAGKIHNKGEPELSESAFEDLTDVVTNASKFTRQFKIPSNLFGSVIDTLLIWSDVKFDGRDGAYALEPFQLDRGRNGSTLASWITAPWRGPRNIILPGFSSGAAAGVKSRSSGDEMFLTSCGFLAAGAKSILISRWRAGGQTSLDLSRDFLIRCQKQAPIDALYDSYAAIRDSELDFSKEVRVKQARKKIDSLKAEHPFFWAGNMLVDLQSSDVGAENQAKQDLAAKNETNSTDQSVGSDEEPIDAKTEPNPAAEKVDHAVTKESETSKSESAPEEAESKPASEEGSGGKSNSQ